MEARFLREANQDAEGMKKTSYTHQILGAIVSFVFSSVLLFGAVLVQEYGDPRGWAFYGILSLLAVAALSTLLFLMDALILLGRARRRGLRGADNEEHSGRT
jgi:hypothetical protein